MAETRRPEFRSGRLEEAAALVRASLVCDAMLPWLCTDQSHAILRRYHAAGFDFVTITVAGDDSPGDAAGDALRSIARLSALLAERPEAYRRVHRAADIVAAREAGQLAVGFNFQGSLPYGKSPELVAAFAALGVRQTLLAYNQMNFMCEGCSERSDAGLSRMGEILVRAMHAAGVIVDGSHVGRRATLDAMALGIAPFVFSHSNCEAVHPHYRNITDEQIRGAAATGGFVGINGLNLFLGDEESRSETIFRHIDHVATLVGPQHAAIGFDYVQFEADIDAYYARTPHVWPTPANGRPMAGFRSAQIEQVAEVTALMLEAGYPRAAIEGILGANYLRVARAVWGA